MRSPLSRSWVVVAAALVAGCSPPEIEIEVVRIGGRLTATLTQDWGWLFRDRQVPCIGEAHVFEDADPAAPDLVWRIEAEDGVQCRDLAELVIGETPAGFRETFPFAAVPGRRYRLSVSGIGAGEASLRV